MNVFKLARKREKAMEELYLKLADQAPTKGIKAIFQDLAASEGSHLFTVNELEGKAREQLSESVEVDMIMTLREINLRKDFIDSGLSQLELYRKVREYELESQRFYEALLGKAKTLTLQTILQEMANEEKSHVVSMENIIELVELPERLRDDAEFGISATGY